MAKAAPLGCLDRWSAAFIPAHLEAPSVKLVIDIPADVDDALSGGESTVLAGIGDEFMKRQANGLRGFGG
ncbi:MAG: hypothetical protein ACXW14_08630 [Burkholderiaceae bacterium]